MSKNIDYYRKKSILFIIKNNYKNMSNNIKLWEQSNWDLLLPNNEIITFEERYKIITSSLETPIRQEEDKIKDIILNNTSAILIWETGSWKTTEFPQIIHELYPNDIIITNIPLVAATIGTASYVSKILYCKTANPYYILKNWWVWYRTWKWVSEQNRTQIGFHTYWLDYLNVSLGNFERFLNTSDKNIHIILDEIHEKSEDFLFYLPRILELRKKYPNRVKVYWASATISDNYLDKLLDNKRWLWNNTPVIRVDWRTFPIDDIIDTWANQVKKAVELYNQWKSILIFEPWKWEIKKVIDSLKKELGEDIVIQEIHSQVSREQLNLVLSLEGVQKIFVATNAARTWITLDINSVVDSGLQKMQYYNEFWIPILLKEGISFDAYMQNRWRAGRKEDGIAVYTWKNEIDDLDLESKSSVEIKVDEKKILTEIFNWVRVEELLNRLLFEPNRKQLELSIDRMKQVWLLTKDNKITTVWFEVLKFPISVFNWRILIEAMEQWIVDKLIPYVSILEERWFITKKFNIKKFKQNFFDKDFSDLEIQEKIFNIFYSETLEDDVLGYLSWLWIERSKLDLFKYSKRLLIDILDDDDFSVIWLNKKNIISINDKISKIKKTISNYDWKINKNLNLSDSELKELISKSILAWNIFNLYEAKSTNKFEAFYNDIWNDLEFEKSDTSYIDISPGSIYTWEAFIIWWDQNDKNIFSLITSIEQWDISYFESKKYKEYKKSNKEKVSDFSVDFKWDTFVVPKYLQDLDKQKKYLAINWLPYFLLRKNEFFIKYRDDYKNKFWFFDEDLFVKLLWKITVKIYWKVSLDKEENIENFINDDSLLNAFLISKDKDISDFRAWKKVEEDKFLNIEVINEEDLILTYIKKIKEYNKTLNEAKKYINNNRINLDSKEKEFLSDLIVFLEENSVNYSNLLIFLKNRKNKWIHKYFSIYERKNDIYEDTLKKISWLESFLEWLEKVVQKEEKFLSILVNNSKKKKKKVELVDLSNINNKELVLKDPLIERLWIVDEALYLQWNFKEIKKSLRKSWIDTKASNDLVDSLSRLLFIDKRKYNRWIKKIDSFILDIWELIKNNIKEIESIKLSLTWEEKNKKIKEIHLKNQNLYILRKKLKNFVLKLKWIRWKINQIEFKDLLLTSSSKKRQSNSSIYNKKFLYNILINTIFSGEKISFSNLSLEEKVISKLNWLSWKLDNDKIKHFIEAIKVFINIGWDTNSFKVIEDFSMLLNIILDDLNSEKQLLLDEMNGEQFSKIKFLNNNMYSLLTNVFDRDTLDINENKIYNFIKKFSSYNISNFDERLKDLISSIWIYKSIKFNNWKEYIKYLDLSYEIKNYILETEEVLEDDLVDEFILRDKIEFLESKIDEIKKKTIEVKKIIDKEKS